LNGFLLDSNVIAELAGRSPDPAVAGWANAQIEARLHLSVLTLGEYAKGIEKLVSDDPRRERIQQIADALSQRFRDRVLPVSNAVVLRWGRISGRVKRETGQAPAVIDTLLAATAIEHDLVLVTRNIRDVRHSGARLFNPWDASAG